MGTVKPAVPFSFTIEVLWRLRNGMDNLTHAAAGLFLSRAGLNRWTPFATPILILAANAPDIDVLAATGGSVNYLHYHRHITHSLIAMPVMALLAILVVRLAVRKPIHWVGAFCAAMIAVLSHLLLDLTNSYGVRLFLPFSSEWLHLDITNVIDLWIWGALLLAIAGPFLARLVGSEISSGAVRDRYPGRGFAVFALSFLLLYNYGRYVLHNRAVAALQSRIYEGATPLRVAALPNAANPFLWRGLVETSDSYEVAELNLVGDFDPSHATVFHKPDPDPAIDAARRTRPFQVFLEFSQYPLWRVTPAAEPENSKLVEVMDMRFGTPLAPAFIATALVDSKLLVLESLFRYGVIRPR
jgi:inner membrane protein